MNLVFFCPAVRSSAIARMTSLVTRALVAAGHDVTVVRTETEDLLGHPAHEFGAPLVFWIDAKQVTRCAATADALFYPIGDSYGFHRGALEWLPNLPGVVCLHDFYLGNLFHGWAQRDLRLAIATLRTWYGDEVAARFFRYPTTDEFIEGTCDASPMTEWVCSMAQGVITHSSWGVDRVLASCGGPVYVAPLAYDRSSSPSRSSDGPVLDRNRFHILTVGHMNANKRVASVIEAIGRSPMLRRRAVYRLIGSIQAETAQQLALLAQQYKVELVIDGQVDDVMLAEAFEQADVVSCLRWPSLEAASASAIEAMLYGKATIVTDTGFYREIPDSCVIKIDAAREIDEVCPALELLCANVEVRRTLGLEAKKWAEVTFTADNYARNIEKMVNTLNRSKPLLHAVGQFVDRLESWGATERVLALDSTAAAFRIFEAP